MKQTYLDLKKQIADLEAKAEEARKQEVAEIVADIKSKIREYGISPNELGFSAHHGEAKPRRPRATAKYQHPETGETWTGRGRMPQWMAQALEEGKTKDSFLIRPQGE